MRKSKSTQSANHKVLKDPLEENLEKYGIGKELGRGEFGVTYQCFDLKTGEACACKKISKTKLKTEIDIDDIMREVEIVKHLPRHPNLVAFREAFEDNEAVYLVMELCRGVSDEAKDIVRSMLDPNPLTRMSIQEVLKDEWIQNLQLAPNFNLGENVGSRIKQFSLMSKFKKKVLRMFNTMDTNANRYLSFEELRDGLQKIGHSVCEHDVKMLIEAADIDGNGSLSCEEFVIMVVHLKRIRNDEHLTQAFHHFDKNQSGYIEFEELREALLKDDPGPNNEQLIKDIMQDVDKDKDVQISYQEFKAMMLTGMDWKMASRQYSRALINAVGIKMLRQSGQLK
ncbi:Calcium-dependent protein kinase 24 [Hibiscus syriacus]|uniref:non-specific serine/threonine protein kinase n=1 Tax=Hibiscus syriacus TaxID=106335 RepID=A0A6A3D0D4_HIBSY|nr:Calcium-dependent protein kinase 24 [Hibiscus syriacus]